MTRHDPALEASWSQVMDNHRDLVRIASGAAGTFGRD